MTGGTLYNVLRVGDGGYALNVADSAQQGFSSDYNLFWLAGGQLARWEGADFANRTDWYYQVGFDGHSLVGDPQFVDFDGADNVLGYSNAVLSSAVLDDSPVLLTGPWGSVGASGFDGDAFQSPVLFPGTGASVATYTFTGLVPGSYRVSATWPVTGASNAPFTFYDGVIDADHVVGIERLGQNALPNDFAAGGASWEIVDVVGVTSGTLVVQLSDLGSSGRVIADAIRVERLEGDRSADDDFHLPAVSMGRDGGDPQFEYAKEPIANGARIDMGAYGNTAEATPSPCRWCR